MPDASTVSVGAMAKKSKNKGSGGGARGKRGQRMPGLLTSTKQTSPALVTATAASPSTSGVIARGTSSLSISDENASDSSVPSNSTKVANGAQDGDDHEVAVQRSAPSSAVNDARAQLERMLLSSLDRESHRLLQQPTRKTFTIDDELPECDDHVEGGLDETLHDEPSTSDRHVYFDERMLTRQSSRQFWHHESRNARRAAFHINTPSMGKRQAMESLLHRLQSQIEDASDRLRRVPSNEWLFLGHASNEPYAEELGYEVRRTIRPRPPVLVWEERPRTVRPMRLSLQLAFELHSPFLSRSAPRSTEMRERVVGVARELVGHAISRKDARASPGEDLPRANWVLVSLPRPLLVWMFSTLQPPRNAGEPYPLWLRLLLRTHLRMELKLRLMQLTIPTFLLYRTSQVIVLMLELVLVASELFLCTLLSLVVRDEESR